MEDFTITKVGWLTKRKGNESRRNEILNRFKIFVQFLQSNHLTVRNLLERGRTIDDEFSIKKSDLTDEGYEVVEKGYDKWLKKTVDKKKDPADTSILQQALDKVRASKK